VPFLYSFASNHSYAGGVFPEIRGAFEPSTDQKGNAMAKSNYEFQRRQKELAKKKKKEEKRQRKLEKKSVGADDTEKDAPILTETR
jgi:hypothetical protein